MSVEPPTTRNSDKSKPATEVKQNLHHAFLKYSDPQSYVTGGSENSNSSRQAINPVRFSYKHDVKMARVVPDNLF